jgi:pimeloyl-ACP methyl ester carboxylesterase
MILTAVAALLEHGQPSSDASTIYDPALQAYNDKENRLGLFVHFYRTGTFLDNVVGVPRISDQVRELPYEKRFEAVLEERRKYLLPLSKNTIPALIVHGTLDTVVPTAEGIKTSTDMQTLGVAAESMWVEGAAHALFDPNNPPNLIDGWEVVADRVLEFIERLLKQ